MQKPHTSLLISDLHLMPNNPKTTKLFVDFCHQIAVNAERLYILGDFFEYWVGDDDHSPFIQNIIDTLRWLSEAGTQLYFLHGNRDFLIGPEFCEKTHMQLIQDPSVINFYGHDILLTHGDYLCTEDKSHLRFRKISGKKWLQKIFLSLPIKARRKIAGQVRNKSKGNDYNFKQNLGDVDETAVMETFDKYGVTRMIHGHTHKMARHIYYKDDATALERIVLGDWHNTGNYLAITEMGGCQQLEFGA